MVFRLDVDNIIQACGSSSTNQIPYDHVYPACLVLLLNLMPGMSVVLLTSALFEH